MHSDEKGVFVYLILDATKSRAMGFQRNHEVRLDVTNAFIQQSHRIAVIDLTNTQSALAAHTILVVSNSALQQESQAKMLMPCYNSGQCRSA